MEPLFSYDNFYIRASVITNEIKKELEEEAKQLSHRSIPKGDVAVQAHTIGLKAIDILQRRLEKEFPDKNKEVIDIFMDGIRPSLTSPLGFVDRLEKIINGEVVKEVR